MNVHDCIKCGNPINYDDTDWCDVCDMSIFDSRMVSNEIENGMRKQMSELMGRVRNLKEVLTLTIRIGEPDLSREVRRQIEIRERELVVLKVQLEKENENV